MRVLHSLNTHQSNGSGITDVISSRNVHTTWHLTVCVCTVLRGLNEVSRLAVTSLIKQRVCKRPLA